MVTARLLLAASAILLASSAQAQTTQCRPTIIGMPSAGVTCETTGGASSTPYVSRPQAPSAPPPAYSWRDVPPTPCSRMEKYVGPATLCAARQVATTRKAVGDLIAAGQCDEALKGALGTGDLQFATEVRAFCAAPAR